MNTPAPLTATVSLPGRLREAASAGFDEWRVQDPKDGSYCIAYSWPDVANPEREARAWLADLKARFPSSQYAGYEVACVRVVPKKDRLLTEAASELTRQHGEMEAMGRWIVEALKVLDTIDPDDMEESEKLMSLIKAGEMLTVAALAPNTLSKLKNPGQQGPACSLLRPWEAPV